MSHMPFPFSAKWEPHSIFVDTQHKARSSALTMAPPSTLCRLLHFLLALCSPMKQCPFFATLCIRYSTNSPAAAIAASFTANAGQFCYVWLVSFRTVFQCDVLFFYSMLLLYVCLLRVCALCFHPFTFLLPLYSEKYLKSFCGFYTSRELKNKEYYESRGWMQYFARP